MSAVPVAEVCSAGWRGVDLKQTAADDTRVARLKAAEQVGVAGGAAERGQTGGVVRMDALAGKESIG